jgi:hypothetical protein
VYEEDLVLTPASGLAKKSLTLEAQKADDGKTATLRATGADAVLVLDRVEGFKLKGFTLDGNKKAEDLVRISGPCPDVSLEDVTLVGFNRAGIRFDGCSGLRDGKDVREIRLRKLRVEAQRAKTEPAVAAIAFGPHGKASNTVNSYIAIQDCRFDGPFQSTIRLGTPLLNVKLERNVFNGGQSFALLFPAEASVGTSLKLTILNNTFWKHQAGIVVQQYPRLDSVVAVSNNLFYEMAQGVGLVQNVGPDTLEGYITGDGNIYDAKSQPGNLGQVPSLRLKKETFELPTSPTSADFLRYAKTSPLAKAGEKESPVGALPPAP